MVAFFLALFLTCACTLMYEVVLTRLLSVISWYYMAFVSVSMAMFGTTLGALFVQLRTDLFSESSIPRRMYQASLALAVALPLTLLTMLVIPIDIAISPQALFSFLLFSAVISVPFFFSGILVCLSLTRTPFPFGRLYFVYLLGAAAGCLGSVGLLKLIDAPSAIFAISGLAFVSAAAYANFAGGPGRRRTPLVLALAMLLVAGLNASTLHGIQPTWSRGQNDPRVDLLDEIWNPISRVRVYQARVAGPLMWGPSIRMPRTVIKEIWLDIDYGAATEIINYHGDPAEVAFLRYDVTSLGAQLRRGGEVAIIGVGGGRDVLSAHANGFRHIVGVEVNESIVNLVARRLDSFSGFSKIPGLELHVDEGRSYLARSAQKFDLIQASLVDTWAATSAGAMTLSENSLYTVEAWQAFYHHLRPGGLISFSRWNRGDSAYETYRMFSLAWAMLLAEGAENPANHIALIGADRVATLLVSNRPLSADDLRRLHAISEELGFERLFFPGERTRVPVLSRIAAARTLNDLKSLRYSGPFDYSPVFDSAPFFFNALRLRNVLQVLHSSQLNGNLRALAFLLLFMLAATFLVILTLLAPLSRRARARGSTTRHSAGGIAYFIGIGLGFMLAEMAMMQQLSVYLGHPVYSLVVVLAGLILFAGLGSLAADRFRLDTSVRSRMPALLASLVLLVYSFAVLPTVHHYVAAVLWLRVALSLALVGPCGFLMGFCFPVGLRCLTTLGQEKNLPWMWALNGAASVLGTFIAMVISMEASITACVITAAGCYLLAGIALPRWSTSATLAPQQLSEVSEEVSLV